MAIARTPKRQLHGWFLDTLPQLTLFYFTATLRQPKFSMHPFVTEQFILRKNVDSSISWLQLTNEIIYVCHVQQLVSTAVLFIN
jgi:hypothetical protein